MLIYKSDDITIETQENSVPVLKSEDGYYSIPLTISNGNTKITFNVNLFISYNHRDEHIVEYYIDCSQFQSVLETTLSKLYPNVDVLEYLLDLTSSNNSNFYFNRKFEEKDEPLYSLEYFIADNIVKLFKKGFRFLNKIIHNPIEIQFYKDDEVRSVLTIPHKVFIYKNSDLYDWDVFYNNLNLVTDINDLSEPFDIIIHTYAISYGNYEFKNRFNSMVGNSEEDTLKLKVVGYIVEPYCIKDDMQTIFTNIPYLNEFRFIVEIPNIFVEEKLNKFKDKLSKFGKHSLEWTIVKDFVYIFDKYIKQKPND